MGKTVPAGLAMALCMVKRTGSIFTSVYQICIPKIINLIYIAAADIVLHGSVYIYTFLYVTYKPNCIYIYGMSQL